MSQKQIAVSNEVMAMELKHAMEAPVNYVGLYSNIRCWVGTDKLFFSIKIYDQRYQKCYRDVFNVTERMMRHVEVVTGVLRDPNESLQKWQWKALHAIEDAQFNRVTLDEI